MPLKPCPCGSGEHRSELYDARNIFCAFYCSQCEEQKRSRYRPEVLNNPDYECDETIEED